MNERQEGQSELVVSSGDASEMFDSGEEALDQIAIFVKMTIEGTLGQPIGTRRDNGLCTRRFDFRNEVIGIVTFVGDNGLCRQMLDGLGRTVDVGNLTGGKNHPQRIAQGIDYYVQLGRQSSTTSTDTSVSSLFFWAAAC